MNTFTATKNDEGRTLLKYLSICLQDVPKSKIESLFRKKDIKVNGKRINDKQYIVKEGDEISVYGVRFSEFSGIATEAEVKFTVIYEDDNILVVDKPINVSIHGDKNSLDNQVFSYLNFVQTDSFKPSHVGRIDKETSGLVLYGKNYRILRELNDKVNDFIKIYKLKSDIKEDKHVKAQIHHNEKDKKEYISDRFGKDTETIIKVKGEEIEAQIITGRKHQIRATMEFLGFPIHGDIRYGGKPSDRLYLHSWKLILRGLSKDFDYLNDQEFISNTYFK